MTNPPMTSHKSASDLGSRRGRDWDGAWEIVSRFVTAREVALQEIARGAPALGVVPVAHGSAGPAERPSADAELARAIAEIEQATAALRRSEPDLESWHPGRAVAREARQYRSVWILIGGIWLSASVMVAGATGALLYLLG